MIARTRKRMAAAAIIALSGGLPGACSSADGTTHSSTDEPPMWELAATPDLSIGVVDGMDEYQFHQVVGAVRLRDGRIAVMNAGSSQLRLYAPDGTFISSHGRAGDGPGEFRSATRLHLIGDTLFVYDGGLQRLSLHDLTGSFIENRPLRATPGRFQLDEWLYDRSWIDGPAFGVGRAPVMNAVSKLPPPDSIELFRYVRVSPYGQLWVRDSREPDAQFAGWHVYDMDADPIGRIRLPARFEVLDFGPDYLLGRMRDELDVEYVELRQLDAVGMPRQRMAFTSSAADTVRQMQSDSAFDQQRRIITGAMRMLAGAQELFYGTPDGSYEYATHITQLSRYEVPEGVDLRIVAANERGWMAVAIDRGTGRMCAMAVGSVTPPGWMPGVVSCQ